MSRFAIILLALLLWASPAWGSGGPRGGPRLEPAPSPVPEGVLRRWRGTGSGVAGGLVYSRGEVIVTDSPFDDHGADTVDNRDPGEDVANSQAPGANAGQGNAGEATGGAEGDDDYPAGAVYARNAADIVETRLAADRRAWYLLVRLGTLNDPSLTAVEARLDGHVLLVHGRAATFDGRRVRVVSSQRRMQFEVRVPRSVFDPGARVLHVFVAAGLWDPDGDDWRRVRAAGAPYFDLGYVPREGFDSYWRDRVQSADIAAESFERDAFPVDFGTLTRGRCPCPASSLPQRGLLTRVMASGQRLGRGVGAQPRFDADSGTYPPNLYRSPYQPYAVYVPQHPNGSMVLLLHFLGGNYMSYPLTSFPGVAEWAERLGAIVVMPEGRGEGGWYQGEAEKDVFEAWRDAAARYPIDRERIYLAGMSMGGFGTWRLASLWPDQFARAIVWAGPVTPNSIWAYPAEPSGPSCGVEEGDCAYNLVDLFGNARNVPLLVVQGGTDDLVPASGPEHWMGLYADSGAPFRYRFYPGRTHETSFPGNTGALVEDWLAGTPRRVRRPTHVTYTVQRNLDQPRFGIHYRGAYWIHGLALARDAARGAVDASLAGGPDTVTPLAPSAATDGLGPFRVTGQDVKPAPRDPNIATLHLTGLRHATLLTRRMGWSATATGTVTGTTDTPLTLLIRGSRHHLAPGRFSLTIPPRGGTLASPRRGVEQSGSSPGS